MVQSPGTTGSASVRELAATIAGSCVSPLEKIKAVHDWIVLNTAYDVDACALALSGKPLATPAARKEGVFERGMAICSGYSSAAEALLKELGVDTVTVVNAHHAWNMVRLEGTWYHLDVTWDDPVPDVPGRVVYNYFLVSDRTLAETRDFTPGRPAPEDFLARLDRWNGLPVVHSLDEVRTHVASAPAGSCDIQMYLWRLDGNEAMDAALKAACARLGKPCREGGFLAAAFQALHLDVSLQGQGLPWQAACSGTDHFKHLQVTTGEVRCDQRSAPSAASAGIFRPWVRLRCGSSFCTLFAASPKSLRMLRETVRAGFESLQDGQGRKVYEYFSPDTPNLEFRLDPAQGWQARVPPDAPNSFLLRPPSGPESMLGPTFTQLGLGCRLVLFSRRQGKPIEPACFQVVES